MSTKVNIGTLATVIASRPFILLSTNFVDFNVSKPMSKYMREIEPNTPLRVIAFDSQRENIAHVKMDGDSRIFTIGVSFLVPVR